MNVFQSASILLPRQLSYEKWAVPACDQFSSDPRYWNRVRKAAEGFPSVMHMILPDRELQNPRLSDTIRYIHETMDRYLDSGLFRQYENAYVYVERTMENGTIRPGLIGAVDLEAYDFRENSLSLIRPSEKIMEDWLPARIQLRQEAALEFPHVQLLCDDSRQELLEPFAKFRDTLPLLYDFDLMEHGGHLTGWLVQGEAAAEFDCRLRFYAEHFREKYPEHGAGAMLFTVGEGNLSLAAAKKCYEARKAANPNQDFSRDPCRYALAELENLYSPALHPEPLHRVVTGANAKAMLMHLQELSAPDGYPVGWCIGPERGVVYLDRNRGHRAAAVLQDFLDDYLGEHPGSLDFVSGCANVEELSSQHGAIGFLLPGIEKASLFPELICGGQYPRKSFDLCSPSEVRFYLEGRKIR